MVIYGFIKQILQFQLISHCYKTFIAFFISEIYREPFTYHIVSKSSRYGSRKIDRNIELFISDCVIRKIGFDGKYFFPKIILTKLTQLISIHLSKTILGFYIVPKCWEILFFHSLRYKIKSQILIVRFSFWLSLKLNKWELSHLVADRFSHYTIIVVSLLCNLFHRWIINKTKKFLKHSRIHLGNILVFDCFFDPWH